MGLKYPPPIRRVIVKLDVRERLVLLSVLPQEGNFVTLKVVRELREGLSFNEDEIKQYKFVQVEGRVTWYDKAEQVKEIEIGEKAMDIIKEALKKLNEGKKLKDEHFTIYEKFVEKG